MLCQPHRNMFLLPLSKKKKIGLSLFSNRLLLIIICMKNMSAVEMMIRIPAVMTGEIESWPCEELMYCCEANMWQEWGFVALAWAWCTALLVPRNNCLQKDKALWKELSQGSVQEQGLSTSFTTLGSLQICCVLVNERATKEAYEQKKIKQSSPSNAIIK